MQFSPHRFSPDASRNRYSRGFVMVSALIFLMILSILAVMAVRGSIFEERFAASDRDNALARENAELALRDAERDVLGLRFDGQYCAAVACTNLRPAGARPVNAADAGNFWSGQNPNVEEVALDNGGVGLGIALQGVYTSLSATQCGTPVWSGADWQDGVVRTCIGTITTSVPSIPYGTFTDAPFLQPGINAPRYLIELFRAGELSVNNGNSNKLLFRITAVGFGRTVGTSGARTSVTLQSTFSAL